MMFIKKCRLNILTCDIVLNILFFFSVIWDSICVPTRDMLIVLYVLTTENRRGICVNGYNSRI